MKLTSHEEKIFSLVKENPTIIHNRKARKKIAEENGLTEKTLRNRIADLKKYGVLESDRSGETINDDELIDLAHYFSLLWRRKSMLFGIIFTSSIVSIIIALLLPVWFKATVVLVPPSDSGTSLGAASLLSQYGFSNIFGSSDSQNRILSILKSRSLKEKVIHQFDLQTVYKKETLQETLESFDNNISIDVGDEGQVIVSVWDKNQDEVSEIANYMAQCLDSINIALTIEDAKSNRVFIANRFDEIMDSLRVLENSMVTLMKTNNILSLEDQVRTGVEQSAILNGQLLQKEIEYDVAQSSTNPREPKVLLLKKEIQSIQDKLKTIFQSPDTTSFFIPRNHVPLLMIKIEQIKRKIDYYSQLIEYIGPLYEKSKIDEVKRIPTIQYLDHATRPDKKDKPKRSVIVILMVMFATIIGGFVIITKETSKQ